VLTGAGTSTASGIPGYRNADGQWMRTPPVLYQDFLRSAASRRRYWRRSMIGWPLLAKARPNAAHTSLASLEQQRHVTRIATQNVDGLHQRAGSVATIELHGSAHDVVCLDCGERCTRAAVQQLLEAANPDECAPIGQAAPDGDVDIAGKDDDDAFTVPGCAHCGGMLKPDVVFFGESVPMARVAAARAALEDSEAMLVVGSSLTVYSGYRFCEWATALEKPIAAINLGRTRADPLLALKVNEACGPALNALVEGLAAEQRRSAGPGRPDDAMRQPSTD
jgi:NAD-dependent SIR2 family protein deacetylase